MSAALEFNQKFGTFASLNWMNLNTVSFICEGKIYIVKSKYQENPRNFIERTLESYRNFFDMRDNDKIREIMEWCYEYFESKVTKTEKEKFQDQRKILYVDEDRIYYDPQIREYYSWVKKPLVDEICNLFSIFVLVALAIGLGYCYSIDKTK